MSLADLLLRLSRLHDLIHDLILAWEWIAMTSKRGRAVFEADLHSSHAPYVLYGTPLPAADSAARDDGSYLPVWKQEVTDEHGRRRLHGAFTGGFSAGYFNTVGSKEGWAPASFVSSRLHRAKDSDQLRLQRPDDFMDEEDHREAEEARHLHTSHDFSGLGVTQSDWARRGGLMDLFRSRGETMGIKLLRRMGWKDGQGIGPKVRRAANLADNASDGEDKNAEIHFFAPDNPPMIAFTRKRDRKGLGFEGETPLQPTRKPGHPDSKDSDPEDLPDAFFGQRLVGKTKPKPNKLAARGAFGVGILNDTGSDDEDPYSMGPQISYNRTLGGEKKKKQKAKSGEETRALVGSSNPLLSTKPVFISRKTTIAKNGGGFRKCHDGRLPLDGFVLAQGMSELSISSQEQKHAPPEIPENWKSSQRLSAERGGSNYRSTAEAAKASPLDPTSRAELLGETQLPGKSVYDWMTPEARERIVRATGRTDLPPALGEKAPKGYQASEREKWKDLWGLVPKLDKDIAIQALNRAASGWLPYAEDEPKRSRYRAFLEIRAGLRDGLPDRAPGSTTDDWVTELQEFARAAEVFKPISGIMASRFTSASSEPRKASDLPGASALTEALLSRPPATPEDPAEAAAKIGMYGPMTRSTLPFYPSRLLCKRFNVKPPPHVSLDPGEAPGREAPPTPSGRFRPAGHQTSSRSKLDLVSPEVMNRLVVEYSGGSRTVSTAVGSASELPRAAEVLARPAIEPDRNEALEAERPGEAVFKAIFGSDDGDED